MFKHLKMPLLAVASLLSGIHAQAAVIDFDGLPVTAVNSPMIFVAAPYVEDGFQITTRGGVSFTFAGGSMFATTPINANWTGSPGLYSDVGDPRYGSAFRLEKVGGGSFSLLSMDAASFWTIASGRNFGVYGATTDGRFVSKTLLLDATTKTLETITFGDDFASLNFVIFSSVYAQVDNIRVSFPGEVSPPTTNVPEPASVAMLAAGLLVAGGRVARRRNA